MMMNQSYQIIKQPSLLVWLSLMICSGNLFSQPQQERSLPNILLIISDQHKLDQTGAYGSKTAITPNIDELARTGVTFTNAYTPAPVCAPARAALLTGMYPYANQAIYHKAPLELPGGKVKNVGSGYMRETGYKEGIVTLAEILRAKGYATAAPGKMHVHGELQKGVDEDHHEGNDMGFDESSVRYYTHFPGGHYEDIVGTDTYQRYRQFKKYSKVYPGGAEHLNTEYVATLVKEEEDNFDMVVARKAVEFIKKSAPAKAPFFLQVGFEKPHPPFTTTKKYLDMHHPANYQLPETHNDWYNKGRYPWVPNWIHTSISKNLAEVQNSMAAYNACVTEMDDMIGRVIKALKETNQYDNTIIIYTTDHGDNLFEHGLRGKHCMYEEAVNIPLIISYPKMLKQGIKVNSLVSLIDLYPTLCELSGSEIPKTVQGKSLVKTLTQEEDFQNRIVYSEFRGGDYQLLPGATNVPSRMLRTGDFKFVYTHGIVHQLYNLKDDPNELENLAFSKTHQELLRELYFKTVADWRFQKYAPMEATNAGNVLKWTPGKNASSYSVFYSSVADVQSAEMLATGITNQEFKVKRKGFYWILADPKFSKTTPRFGDTPVAVKDYSYELPVSDAVQFL